MVITTHVYNDTIFSPSHDVSTGGRYLTSKRVVDSQAAHKVTQPVSEAGFTSLNVVSVPEHTHNVLLVLSAGNVRHARQHIQSFFLYFFTAACDTQPNILFRFT